MSDLKDSNWHERTAFQRLVFQQSTAGNEVVATILINLFPLFSPSQPFLIEGVLGSKNLIFENCLEHPKTKAWLVYVNVLKMS